MEDDYTDVLRDVREDRYHLDGSAAGGLLADVFGREVTGASAACGKCGAGSPVGALILYMSAPGKVLTCPGCGATLFTVVHMPDGYRITFEHLHSLKLPPESEAFAAPHPVWFTPCG